MNLFDLAKASKDGDVDMMSLLLFRRCVIRNLVAVLHDQAEKASLASIQSISEIDLQRLTMDMERKQDTIARLTLQVDQQVTKIKQVSEVCRFVLLLPL